MRVITNVRSVRQAEQMVREEMEPNGHIMVRSLDRIHARTGLTYVEVSEIARRLAKTSPYAHKAI